MTQATRRWTLIRPMTHHLPFLLTPNCTAKVLPHLPHRAAHLHHLLPHILMTLSSRRLQGTSRSNRRRKRARRPERVFRTDFGTFHPLYQSQLLFDTGNWIYNVQSSEQPNQRARRRANDFASAGLTQAHQRTHYTILAAKFTG